MIFFKLKILKVSYFHLIREQSLICPMTLSIWLAFGTCLTFPMTLSTLLFENPQIHVYFCILSSNVSKWKTQHFLEKHAAGENNLMMLSNVFSSALLAKCPYGAAALNWFCESVNVEPLSLDLIMTADDAGGWSGMEMEWKKCSITFSDLPIYSTLQSQRLTSGWRYCCWSVLIKRN